MPATPAERHEDTFTDEEAPRSPSFDEEDVSGKPSSVKTIGRVSDEEASEVADPSLIGDLKARLDALRICAGDECREAEDAQ